MMVFFMQMASAAHYEAYVRGALANPAIVGTHWFQYHDQATTGRGDGENYQIGFVSICDAPYPETIAASRRVGAEMYEIRSRKKKKSDRSDLSDMSDKSDDD